MPSDPPRRSSKAGFTLLESLLAFAALASVLGATYSVSVRAMHHQIDAERELEMTRMARAVLDEYIVTYPMMPKSGTYRGTWDWRITETSEPVLQPTEFDYYFSFVRIAAQVRLTDSDKPPQELSTVIARRAPGI